MGSCTEKIQMMEVAALNWQDGERTTSQRNKRRYLGHERFPRNILKRRRWTNISITCSIRSTRKHWPWTDTRATSCRCVLAGASCSVECKEYYMILRSFDTRECVVRFTS